MSLSIVPSCLGLRMSQQLVNSGCLQQEMRFWNCGRLMMKVAQVIRPRIIPCIEANANGLQVFVLSDLHTDYSENMTWVRGLSRTVGQNKDVLLVAGDVAETRNNFVLTMSLLKDRFAHVFFVPGNHDGMTYGFAGRKITKLILLKNLMNCLMHVKGSEWKLILQWLMVWGLSLCSHGIMRALIGKWT
nr:Calcineurin-like phosphoesterase domain, apaH type [Ipomoea batatas]